MLNIGIIGITEVLEPHVKRIQKNKDVNVIGKASVGTSSQINSFHFSIPEYNRIELIERADILLVDKSSLLPFEMLCEIIKKSKHIFATEYLKLSVDECKYLEKLAYESGSVIQVSNPYFFTDAIQWLNSNISTPVFLDISYSKEVSLVEEMLFPTLLMLVKLTGLNPKKIGVSSFKLSENNTGFTNVRLEFGNTSVVNLNLESNTSGAEFAIKAYSKNKFVFFDIQNTNYLLNNSKVDISGYCGVNEFDTFIQAIQNRDRGSSNLLDYQASTQLVESVVRKIDQLIS